MKKKAEEKAKAKKLRDFFTSMHLNSSVKKLQAVNLTQEGTREFKSILDSLLSFKMLVIPLLLQVQHCRHCVLLRVSWGLNFQ